MDKRETERDLMDRVTLETGDTPADWGRKVKQAALDKLGDDLRPPVPSPVPHVKRTTKAPDKWSTWRW